MLLPALGTALNVFAIAAAFTRRLPHYGCCGLLAAGFLALGVDHGLDGASVRAGLDAGAVAWFGWQWWTGGGGDGLRRRLRRWVCRFRAVRRAAPT